MAAESQSNMVPLAVVNKSVSCVVVMYHGPKVSRGTNVDDHLSWRFNHLMKNDLGFVGLSSEVESGSLMSGTHFHSSKQGK